MVMAAILDCKIYENATQKQLYLKKYAYYWDGIKSIWKLSFQGVQWTSCFWIRGMPSIGNPLQ